MNISILGTGNVGSGLAKTFSKTDHVIYLGSRDQATAQAKAKEMNTETTRPITGVTTAEAIDKSKVIFLAVPFDGAIELLKSANVDLTDKIIVDVTNPLTEDFMNLTVGHDTSAAEEIQSAFPGAHVVKAFNTVFAQILHEGPDFGSQNVPVYVASDKECAQSAVMKLVEATGFEAINSGILKNARYLEPMAAMNIQFGYVLGLGTQIAPAWISR
jgi:hypothetical protein|tara:strand:+ start:890 stop:1534 length:645 start_codon:yes stop_codon:yes gene_type:complete